MEKIIQFKKANQEKIKKQYELEDCDSELLELAEKLLRCNPGKSVYKKKEEFKSEFLKKAEEYSFRPGEQKELSEDELDAAAGGILHPEETIKDPIKE